MKDPIYSIRQDIKERSDTGVAGFSGLSVRKTLVDSVSLVSTPAKTASRQEEEPDTRCVIGKGRSHNPMRLSFPLMIAPPRVPSLKKEFVRGYLSAALRMGLSAVYDPVHNLSIKELEELAALPGSLVVRIGGHRSGLDMNVLNLAGAVEVDLTEADRFGGRANDIRSVEDAAQFLMAVREAVDYRVPVSIRIDIGSVREDIVSYVIANYDLVILDDILAGNMKHLAVDSSRGMDPLSALGAALSLPELELDKKGIKIAVSTDVWSGSDIVKYLAAGASLVSTTTPVLVSAGCTLCGRCPDMECEAGLFGGTVEPLDEGEYVKRIGNLVMSWSSEARQLLSSLGISGIASLSRQNLVTHDYSTAVATGVNLAGYGRPAPLWE